MGTRLYGLRDGDMSIGDKLGQINWLLVVFISIIAVVGFIMLYSAGGGNTEPWAMRHAVRFGIALVFMLGFAVIDLRFWFQQAYTIYAIILILLAAVDLIGMIGMGAQRWLDFGVFIVQPSELMKLAVILALARYFHSMPIEDLRNRPLSLIVPIVLVLVPVALVIKQPDLGTAVMILCGATAMMFLAGVRWWKFIVIIIAGCAAIPLAWQFLHDYQKERVLTFLDPERDPLGRGYHILQSKIALGAGGVFGKGYLQGSQSHLNFLPEKQTDFVFTMLGEEMGLLGGLGLIFLYVLVIAYGYSIALRCRHHFGRLLAIGVSTTFFLYMFVNMAMVTGLIPVVGVPLPLVSYGGTAMLTVMLGFGLVLSVNIHRDIYIGRRGDRGDW
ncbi:MAG: rod shape-determining protein RodA [Alphaproteobacteria bacterium]